MDQTEFGSSFWLTVAGMLSALLTLLVRKMYPRKSNDLETPTLTPVSVGLPQPGQL